MHILWDPSFFFKNIIGAPQGELLDQRNPLSNKFCSCIDNSCISDSARRQGALAIGAAPGTISIQNSTYLSWGTLGKSYGKTYEYSQTTNAPSIILFFSYLVSNT